MVEGVLRPPLKRGWPAELCTLLQECWHVTPERRPRTASVHARLRELCASLRDQALLQADHAETSTRQCRSLSRLAAWFLQLQRAFGRPRGCARDSRVSYGTVTWLTGPIFL